MKSFFTLRSWGVIASSILLFSLAQAKPVIVKDWALDDTSPDSCLASTNRTINSQNYRLELSLDRSGRYPVEIWIREIPGTAQTRAFKFTTEVRPSKNFAFAPFKDASGNTVFWQVPTDTATLVSYLKRETRFLAIAQIPNGAAAPTLKAVDFSLRGSSAVIDALISQCNKNQTLDRGNFEQSFIPVQTATLDPLKLDEDKTAQLRSLYMGALVANDEKLRLLKELGALNTQYAKQIQELAKVTGTLDQLTQKELITLQNQKTVIQARIVSLENQINSQQAAIAAKESEIVQANGRYDAAWKILAPYEAEHKRLASQVQMAKEGVAINQKRLSDIDGQIGVKARALTTAENSVPALRSQISQNEIDLRNARNDADNSDSDYRRFDGRRERDARLREHPLLRYCFQNRAEVCGWTARNIESDINNEVETIGNRLRSNVDVSRTRVNQRQAAVDSLNSRLRDLVNYEIPDLRNQLTDLRNQRPAIESSLVRARTEVSNAVAALQSYDTSVGYAEKKAAVDSASQVVIALRAEMSRLESDKQASVRNRETQTLALLDTDKKIDAVLIRIRETEERSSELNQALVPYFTEKSRLETSMSQYESAIASNKMAYASIIAAP